MATRSRIGIELSDGSILSSYHHWDGYESWLGRILKTHYNSKELAAELIDGGDMSTCWNEDNQPEYYSASSEYDPTIQDNHHNGGRQRAQNRQRVRCRCESELPLGRLSITHIL